MMLLLYAKHIGAGCAVRQPCQGTGFQAETLPATQAKGAVKKASGKVMGDARLQAEGKAEKAEGKLQNAVGGLKNAIRKV